MSDMIERVAKAISGAWLDEANWRDYLIEARAAIEAMREPLLQAAESVLDTVHGQDLDQGWVTSRDVARRIVDAALSEKP